MHYFSYFEMESHYVILASLKLAVYIRLVLNSQKSALKYWN